MLRLFFSIMYIVWIFHTKSVAQNNSLILGVSGGASLSKMKHDGDFTFGSGNEIDSRKIGYGGGIDLGIKVGKFSFLSGFKYNIRNAQNEIQLLDQKGPVWTYYQNGQILWQAYGRRFRDYRYSTFAIPLQLRYMFGAENFQFSIQAGININLMQGEGSISEKFVLDNTTNNLPNKQFSLTKGVSTSNLFNSNYTSFIFSPGILFSINDNGFIKFNVIFESSNNLNNPNYIDAEGIYKFEQQLRSSLKSSNISFEVGYEHRFNFELGSKY